MTKVSSPPRVRRAPRREFAGYDWPRILGDIAWLLGEPMPGAEHLRVPVGGRILGEYLGLTRGAIRRWLEDGAEPRHDDGEYVIGVWVELTGKARQFLPARTVTVLSASKFKG